MLSLIIICECHAHYLPHINDVSECLVVIVAEWDVFILRVMPLTFEFMHICQHGGYAGREKCC